MKNLIYFFLITTIFSSALIAEEIKVEAPQNLAPAVPIPLVVASQDCTISENTNKEFQKKMDYSGDFRYRYQTVTQGSNQERRINRIMFRVGQSFQVQDDLKIVYRLLTGTSATSGNVTVGDSKTPGAPRQSIGLDHAFANYTPSEEFSIFIGKFPQFFYTPGKNQIILDNDIATEGLAAQLNYSIIDKILKTNINVGSFWIREKYDDTAGEDQTDSFLNMAQLNLSYQPDEQFELLLGYGLFSYTAIKDDKAASFVAGATSSKGNTLDLLGNYQSNYEIVQNYIELKWKLSPFNASIFTEIDQNTAADSLNKASAIGFSLGWKKLTFTYLRKKLENDSVLAIYTDSDFADGQTASQGYMMSLSYKANKNFSLSLTQQKAQQSIDIAATDYNRTHIDLNFSF